MVAYSGEVLLKGFLTNHHCAATVVRVETKVLGLFEAAIQEKYYMVLSVVDQTERADAAGLQAQIPHHPFRRSKRQLTRGVLSLRYQHLFEPMLDVVDGEVIVAGEAYEVMLIALVVTHEYVFAMHTPVVVPPLLGLFYCLAFGVVIRGERNAVCL